tara:strand:+ start:1294 stop:1710 length:417 start_codon:yes stop_codon:yes gene_type:complete
MANIFGSSGNSKFGKSKAQRVSDRAKRKRNRVIRKLNKSNESRGGDSPGLMSMDYQAWLNKGKKQPPLTTSSRRLKMPSSSSTSIDTSKMVKKLKVTKPAKKGQAFRQAFAKARREQGPGGVFTFKGKKYNTNRADDK